MTWEDARGLARGKWIAVLPVGAIEAHGPHLPLGTDVIIARAMARAGTARLTARGGQVVTLPPLTYTAAPFAADFAGTLSIAPERVTAYVVELGRALRRSGARALAIVNSHLDPAHLGSLAAAAEALRAGDGIPVIFPDLTRKPWALRLGEEFASGACHAGRFETSIVLAESPELVRESIRAALPSNPASISRAIKDGKRSFEEAGGPGAYFGDPAAASAEEGLERIDALGAILEEAVLDALPDLA
jgi:creatinine amidohydrolase